MQPKHRFNESPPPPPVEQPDPIPNGNKDNVLEMPPREDQLLRDSLGIMMQCLAEDREARREDREVTRALLAKMANGNGERNKLQGWITPLAGALLILFAGVAWFPKQETKVEFLSSEVTTLRREIAEEREERKLKQTYDEKMRGNLRELGISIDPVTAEVTVVVPRKVRR